MHIFFGPIKALAYKQVLLFWPKASLSLDPSFGWQGCASSHLRPDFKYLTPSFFGPPFHPFPHMPVPHHSPPHQRWGGAMGLVEGLDGWLASYFTAHPASHRTAKANPPYLDPLPTFLHLRSDPSLPSPRGTPPWNGQSLPPPTYRSPKGWP